MNKIVAKEGKVFKNKLTGEVLGFELYLAKNDSIDNYEQVDKPVEEEITQGEWFTRCYICNTVIKEYYDKYNNNYNISISFILIR